MKSEKCNRVYLALIALSYVLILVLFFIVQQGSGEITEESVNGIVAQNITNNITTYETVTVGYNDTELLVQIETLNQSYMELKENVLNYYEKINDLENQIDKLERKLSKLNVEDEEEIATSLPDEGLTLVA
jgi:peptidoglycan hydrolase CwlO-like protein